MRAYARERPALVTTTSGGVWGELAILGGSKSGE